MDLLTRVGAATALLAVVLVVGVAGCGAAAQPAPLFREPPRQPAASLPESPRILRSRYVEVDFDTLGGVNATVASTPSTLQLNLFPDATFITERDGAEATSTGGVIWTGRLQGVVSSAVTLVSEGGVLVGNVQADRRYYEVRYAGDGLHTVAETNPAVFGPD
jgi:hypothetical protein